MLDEQKDNAVRAEGAQPEHADTRRMDWLARTELAYSRYPDGTVWVFTNDGEWSGPSLRAAIDAAMQADAATGPQQETRGPTP